MFILAKQVVLVKRRLLGQLFGFNRAHHIWIDLLGCHLATMTPLRNNVILFKKVLLGYDLRKQ